MLDTLARAVVVTDPDGVIVLWNRAAGRLYGWSEHEVLGGRSSMCSHRPTTLPENRQDLESVAGGAAMTGDRFVKRRDGSTVRVHTFTAPMLDEQGATVAIVGSSEDVGELRLAEQQARDLFEHFRLALEAGGLGTWRWDMATGEIRVGPTARSAVRLACGRLRRQLRHLRVAAPPRRPRGRASRRRATLSSPNRITGSSIEWCGPTARFTGSAVPVESPSTTTVRSPGRSGCSMDITDRMEQELERQRLADAAAVAAENERLQRERLEFLAAINEALNASSTAREVMVNVTRQAVPTLGDWCTIHVLAPDGRSAPDVEVAHVDPAMVGVRPRAAGEIPVRSGRHRTGCPP